jgi:hypothetical protein
MKYQPTRPDEYFGNPAFRRGSIGHQRMTIAITFSAWLLPTLPLIPSDDETLATLSLSTEKEWAKARAKVFKCGFREEIDEAGLVWWRHKQLDDAYAMTFGNSKPHVVNGALGGEVKAANAKAAAILHMPKVDAGPATQVTHFRPGVNWIIQELFTAYPKAEKITEANLMTLGTKLAEIIDEKSRDYWKALIALITTCKYQNNHWGLTILPNCKTEEEVLAKFVNCLKGPKGIMAAEQYGGVIDAWCAGDPTKFQKRWKAILVDKDGRSQCVAA